MSAEKHRPDYRRWVTLSIADARSTPFVPFTVLNSAVIFLYIWIPAIWIGTTKLMYKKENRAKLKKMDALAPQVMKAFWAFDKAAVAEGAISVKHKELIAVAVALTTQCPYCIEIHSGNARKAGATEAEIVEAAMVAASLRAGGAVTHATHALHH